MAATSLQDRLRALAALERRHALFDHRIDGWSAWRVLRFQVFQTVSELPLSTVAVAASRRIAAALWGTVRLAGLLLRGRQRGLVVKTYRSGLRVCDNGRWRDVYFDALLERRADALKLEVVNSAGFGAQAAAAWRQPDLDAAVFTFWGRVLGRLRPVDDGGFSDKAASVLADGLGQQIQPQLLRLRLSSIYWQIRLYSLLLARVRPRTVLVADTGDFALSIACRRQGIHFIELQHGVFDADHPDAVPGWVAGSDAELILPQRLATFGSYWIDRLAGSRLTGGIAVPVGNQLIDAARQRQQTAVAGGTAHLVVTSQGMDSERLAQWLGDMLDAAPVGQPWRLSLKLHPAYDDATTAYDQLAQRDGVRLVAGAALPNVFDLLAEADLHLSIGSACHFDAAALGVPSLVVPLTGHELMLPALDGQTIMLASTPASVWPALLAARAHPNTTDNGHRFATPGCIDNLERLLA